VNTTAKRKKILNMVTTLAITAIVALNVHVVTNEQTPAFLKWDVVGKILADGTSGSGVTPKCVKLGDNFPGQQSFEDHFYCSASGKTETTVSFSGSGGGCQEVVKK